MICEQIVRHLGVRLHVWYGHGGMGPWDEQDPLLRSIMRPTQDPSPPLALATVQFPVSPLALCGYPRRGLSALLQSAQETDAPVSEAARPCRNHNPNKPEKEDKDNSREGGGEGVGCVCEPEPSPSEAISV